MKKHLFKLLLLAVSLALSLALVSCGECDTHVDENADGICDECNAEIPTQTPPDTPDTPDTPVDPEPVYYNICFWVNGNEHVVRTKAGELPVFTGNTDKPMSESAIYTFNGWNKTIVPATEDTTYIAKYKSETRKYTVTYTVEGATVGSDDVEYGKLPTPPSSHNGKKIMWVGLQAVSGETSVVGYYTLLDPDMASWAMEAPLLSYSTTSNYENTGSMVKSSSALLYLALGEYENPNVTIRDRILQHLRSLIAPGHEPGFNAGPFWHYATVSMSIMVCRYTDTVWSQLNADEKARLDLIMECYAILTTFVSDDQNTYKTGPALTGNFGKTWNPNHRMAMILPIVAATQYFSYGGADGAAYINNMLLNFDHDAYIEKFDAFGFTRAKYNWTTEGRTLDNGTLAPGAKQLMMNGGYAYICHQDSGSISNGIEIGTPVGSGVGVRTEYTYGGATLYQLDLILEKLYSYNYSGGLVISDTSGFSNGVDPMTKKPYAYIVDGTKSPFEGEYGMMKEFISSDAGGIRSSTSYCTHDFMLVVQSFAAMTTIGAYEIDVTDPLYRQMWVGNGDLMYKNEHGYNSYSIGKDRGQAFDKDHLEYLPWKAWWQEHHGDAFTLTRSISYTLNGGYADGLVTSYAQSEQEQSFTLPTPTHKVGTFVGWFLDADGKTTSVQGVKIADGKLTVEKNYFKHISLYAIFTIPDGINVGEIKYVIPSGATLTGIYDSVYYFDGTDEQISLPTLSLEDGYSFIGWYKDYKFSTEKLSETYTVPAADMQDSVTVIFYARVEKTIFSQTEGQPLDPTTIPTTKTVIINGETLPSLSQTVCDDGSIMFTKLADGRGDKSSDGWWRQENLKMNSGALTVSMTIYKDGVLPLVKSGFRIRESASANTTNFVEISSAGTVKLLKNTMGTITEEASTFTFILYANRDQNGNFVDGFTIDGYLDGELVFSGLEYDIALNAKDAKMFHWYFGVSDEGSMHVKDLSFTDGVVIPE